jgi:hypothetical protein
MKVRIVTAILVITLLSVVEIFSEGNGKDPFAGYTFLRKPQDIATLGSSWINPNLYINHQVWDFKYFIGRGDSIVEGPSFTDITSDSLLLWGLSETATGNFTGDSRDEVATVWETADRAFVLTISEINPITDEWHNLSSTKSDTARLVNIPYPADSEFYYGTYDYRLFRLVKGNFDSDAEDEFVLAYWNADSTLTLELYDGSSGFASPKAVVSDQKLSTHLYVSPGDGYFRMFYFDIAVADFDGDGMSEVILFGKEKSAEPQAKIFAAVYDYNPLTSTFTRTAKVDVPHGLTMAGADRLAYIYATAGHMNAANKGDGFVTVAINNGRGYPNKNALLPFDVSSDLSTVMFGTPQNCSYIPSTYSVDMNNDGFDETFIVRQDSVLIMALDTLGTPKRIFGFVPTPFNGSETGMTRFYYPARHSSLVMDMDSDTSGNSWMPEFIIGEEAWPYMVNPTYRLSVYDFVLDSTDKVQSMHLRMIKPGYPPEVMVAGNFNGGDIRLGVPAHFSKTDILQPIVILNAPPIHFDVLDGVKYDISKSFSPNTCQFYSRYQKVSQNSVEVQTKVTESWATSESFGASFSYMGIGANFSMEQRYGKNFSKVANSSRTITISEQIDAALEDEIFATVVDYDIWEYPVYASDALVGHMLVIDPLQVSNRWFSSKGWSANDYVPNHEIGNILSYQRFPTLASNIDVAALISGTYDKSYELGPSPLADWSLVYNDFASSQTETTKKIGIDLSVGSSFFGISFGGKDSYDREEISTHQISVTQNLAMNVHFDAIAMSLGEVRYTVTPYSYWATNGALVIDYAVLPDLAQPGYTPTWWQVNYDSLPDPAFILPWRLDPEKGFPLQDDAKRHETKEIQFSSSNPTPGDTITIRVRIHNYSLSPTVGTVKIRFYIGDPDNGGTLITGLNGETELATGTFIKSRENTYVSMQWKIPAGLAQYPRIYAVLDPENEIAEIHEENNKGFSVLGKQGITSVEDIADESIPKEYSLAQNYPNPFNPSTTFTFSVPQNTVASLKIFDIVGREVATLMENELVMRGTHERQWNASHLSSGVYFYRLQAGSFVETKKLVLMK